MASGPCLRRCRVVRRYMPTNIKSHRLYVKLCSAIHVSMYYEPCREVSAVNTGVPCPKVPIHRKLGSRRKRAKFRVKDLGRALVTPANHRHAARAVIGPCKDNGSFLGRIGLLRWTPPGRWCVIRHMQAAQLMAKRRRRRPATRSGRTEHTPAQTSPVWRLLLHATQHGQLTGT